MVTSSAPPSEAVFKAIADTTRRDILNILRQGSRTVGELARNFRVSRPAISKHVRVLRSAGLIVSGTTAGGRRCELNAQPLQAVDAWLRDYQNFWNASLRDLKHYVEEQP